MMAIVIDQKTLSEIKSLVALNDHGGAYQLAAEALGCGDLAERFASINRRQLELGHLPHKLYDERFRMLQELLSFARINLSSGDYQRFYAAF